MNTRTQLPPAHLRDVCRFASDGRPLPHDYAPSEPWGIGYTRLHLTYCRVCWKFVLESIGRGDECLDDLLANSDAYQINGAGPCWPSIEAPGARRIPLAHPQPRTRRRVARKTASSIRAEQIREYLRRKHEPATVRELERVLRIPGHALYSRHLQNVAQRKYGIAIVREPGQPMRFEARA